MSVFVQNDRLVVDYNAFDDHTIVESDIEVPVRRLDARRPVPPRRRHGGQRVARRSTARRPGRPSSPLFMRMISSVGPSIAYDHGSAVSNRYVAPFAFAGTLHEVVIQLLSPQDLDALAAEAAAEMSRQ